MGWFQIVQLILSIVPMVEKMLPQAGQGNTKFGVVLNTVKAAAAAAPIVVDAVQGGTAAVHAGNVEQLTGNIGQLINGIVAAFNQAGVFQKSALVQNAAPLPGAAAVEPAAVALGAQG